MLPSINGLAAFAVLAHHLTTVIAAPVPFGLSDIVDGISEIFDSNLVNSLLGNDQAAVASKAVSSTISGTLSPDLFPDILYFAEFSGVAYCDPGNTPGQRVSCTEGVCPTVQANAVTTIVEFDDTQDTDTTGIVARDDTTKTIVITFRGSQSLRNWLANVQLLFKDVPEYCDGCQVHTGFHEAFLEGFPTVLAAFVVLKAENPDYRAVVTGHSLGGAIATITATELRRLGNEVDLYTYGSPRVGNGAMAASITAAGKNFRVTHTDDPVPRLPPVFLEYEHVSPEFHITRGNSNIQPQDINILEGGVNLGGNTGGSTISLDIHAHLNYFLPVLINTCGGLVDFDIFEKVKN